MMIQMREAIQSADVDALRKLVAGDAALADADIEWGPGNKNKVPPLHFICDAVFQKLCSQEDALAMANVLLDAGAKTDLVFPKSGDTLLISAASLGAEDVGLRYLECGIDIHARGTLGATALHWCAYLGLPRLAKALIEAGAKTDARDGEYDNTPLGWAEHAWRTGTNGYRDAIPVTYAVLGGDPADLPDPDPGALA